MTMGNSFGPPIYRLITLAQCASRPASRVIRQSETSTGAMVEKSDRVGSAGTIQMLSPRCALTLDFPGFVPDAAANPISRIASLDARPSGVAFDMSCSLQDGTSMYSTNDCKTPFQSPCGTHGVQPLCTRSRIGLKASSVFLHRPFHHYTRCRP